MPSAFHVLALENQRAAHLQLTQEMIPNGSSSDCSNMDMGAPIGSVRQTNSLKFSNRHAQVPQARGNWERHIVMSDSRRSASLGLAFQRRGDTRALFVSCMDLKVIL